METRLSGAPASLRERILESARAIPTDHALLPGALRDLGDHLLVQARAGPPTRETAVTLLAADTLITLACEVVADTDPRRLAELR